MRTTAGAYAPISNDSARKPAGRRHIPAGLCAGKAKGFVAEALVHSIFGRRRRELDAAVTALGRVVHHHGTGKRVDCKRT